MCLGMVLAVCFRSLSKLLNQLDVHFSHLSIHEVGLLQLFKDALENTGSFSMPVLSSLKCGLSLGVIRRQVHPWSSQMHSGPERK